MNHGTIDIIRQGNWDLWALVCAAGTLALIVHAALRKPWRAPVDRLSSALVAIGVAGSAAVLAIPALHRASVGLAWTILLLGLVSATFYLSLRGQLSRAKLATLLSMRLLAVALLVPMLFEPVLRYVQAPVITRPLVVLIDTSGSMSVADVQNGPSRLQSVWQTIGPMMPAIREHFIPKFYRFDSACSALSRPEDVARLNADGKSTDIVSAINSALKENTTENDPTFVLISDGADNVSSSPANLIASSGRKIDTISVGSADAQPANVINVAVDSVSAPRDLSVGHEGMVTANIKSTSLDDRVVEVKLSEMDASDKPVSAEGTAIKRLILKSGPGGQKIDLPYTPSATGVRTLAVWVDPVAGERNLADNRQECQALVVDPRMKVLYIEGRLRPEYTFLHRLLSHDANIELATLLQKQMGRFAAEGTVDGQPFTALPASLEEWKKFDVVMLGDIESALLPPTAQEAIRQRVSEGGGLVMIGGQRNFGAGQYEGTPIEQALPVLAGKADAPQEVSEFVPELSAEGLAHPMMEGLGDAFARTGQAQAPKLAPLKGNAVVAGLKQGAQVLLSHPGTKEPDGAEQVVLAVEQYGKGRSAAFTADTTNIWFRQFREEGQDNAYNRFWGQLIRWLAGQDVRNRGKSAGVDVLLDKSVYAFGQTPHVIAIVRDAHGDTTQFAIVQGSLQPAQGPAATISLIASTARVGTYEADLAIGNSGLKAGDYTLTVQATKDGEPIGKQTIHFTVVPPDDEMTKIAADPTLMEAIAAQTGGYHRLLAEFPELIDTLIAADPASKSTERIVPLANTFRMVMTMLGKDTSWPAHADLPMQGAIVLALLIGEWSLRRYWQLP